MTYIPKQKPLSWMHKARVLPQKKIHSSGFKYDSREWRKLRKMHLNKSPFCVECQRLGIVTIADMVDHVIRIEDEGAPKDERNFQSLCNYHHNVKRGKERHGYIAPYKFNHNDEKIPE